MSVKMPVPQTWTSQATNNILVSVERGTPEWRVVASQFTSSLPKYTITRIERVQNQVLWHRFFSQRQAIALMRGEDGVNERLLFHGTSAVPPPVIFGGSEGFDPRLSVSHGFYGTGSYFAEKASYTDHGYAHRLGAEPSSPRQMFLAQVLCGTCHDFGTAHGRDLKRPPSVPGKEHELCDSVKGGPHAPSGGASEAAKSVMHVVYTNSHAYPAYLITYKRA